MSWDELPGPCLQAVALHLPTSDVLAARSTCSSWARALPLPQVSLSLTAAAPGLLSAQAGRRLQHLLQAVTEAPAAFGPVRQLVLSVTPASADDSSPAVGDSCMSPPPPAAAETLMAQALASLPCLDSISIRVRKPLQQPSPVPQQQLASALGHPPASLQDCHAVLCSLLAQPQLQQRLRSLTLACQGAWPSHQRLAGALVQLPSLDTLVLHNCPLSSLTRLPALPQLRRLSVSGRYLEPVPRSYSVRQLPTVPALPGLQALQLVQMPLDVHSQEHEDITAARLTAQRRRAAATGTPSCRQRADLSSVSDWRTVQQWVGSSILQQCPNLRQLQTDMVLGPAVTQLAKLVVLQPPSGAASGMASQCALAGTSGQAAVAAAAKGHTPGSSKPGPGASSLATAAAGVARQDAASAWQRDQRQVPCPCCSSVSSVCVS